MNERFKSDKIEDGVPGAIKWYAVDLDGTLAYQIWPELGIGDPIGENIVKYMELADNGEDLMIHSARPWGDYQAVESWLNEHRIPYDAIILGKLIAKRYIDDKAVHADEPTWLV